MQCEVKVFQKNLMGVDIYNVTMCDFKAVSKIKICAKERVLPCGIFFHTLVKFFSSAK